MCPAISFHTGTIFAPIRPVTQNTESNQQEALPLWYGSHYRLRYESILDDGSQLRIDVGRHHDTGTDRGSACRYTFAHGRHRWHLDGCRLRRYVGCPWYSHIRRGKEERFSTACVGGDAGDFFIQIRHCHNLSLPHHPVSSQGSNSDKCGVGPVPSHRPELLRRRDTSYFPMAGNR